MVTVPPEIRNLIALAISDPLARVQMLHALEVHIEYLCAQGREDDAIEYLDEMKESLLLDIETHRKNESRSRFKVIPTLLAPAFVSVLTKVLTDHMPFG